VFVGAVYWAMCFSMSRYAKHLEGVLASGEKR
jgi:ABC-type amino acid transport system permease subunit